VAHLAPHRNPVAPSAGLRSLGLLLLCAALAALFAWVARERALAAFGPEVRVAAGGGLSQ